MSKVFEDAFSEIQIDMIKICLAYAEYTADKVYVYASYEGGVISCDYFYQINHTLVQRHKLNDIGVKHKYDVSPDRQGKCLNILNADMDALSSVCKEYNQPMPTEIKLIYDAVNRKVMSKYAYDLKYSNTKDLTADDMAEQWFEEEKQKL